MIPRFKDIIKSAEMALKFIKLQINNFRPILNPSFYRQADQLIRVRNQQYLVNMEDKFQRIFLIVNREVSLEAFQKYIFRSSQHKQQLFDAIRQSNTQGFPRFNIWRLLLQIMPINGDFQQKKQAIQASRKRWAELKQQAKTGIKATAVKQVVVPKNPLMKVMAKTQKKQTQSDSFLNQQIKKDVDRTYQQLQFFQDQQILKLLTSVLFVWCKINSEISYKQGMNELLASIVYVYFQEASPLNIESSSPVQQNYIWLNSVAHAQADVFAIFQKVMDIQKDMYKQNLDSEVKGLVNPNSKNNSPILQRIIQIQDQKLKALDLQLFRVLKLQDVKTKTFLLRWIRCLHTRQFGLINSLYIWDSIFLDAFQSPNSKNRHQYEFVDAMCLAMFIYLRSVAVTRETANEILQIYQKYPPLQGQFLYELIQLAWSVCEQLRLLANNPGATSNWIEQSSSKVIKLGLMQKGGYNNSVKKQEVQERKKSQEQIVFKQPPKQIDQVKQKDIFVNSKKPSSTEKPQTHNNTSNGNNNGDLFAPKPKADILSRKSNQNSQPVQPAQPASQLFKDDVDDGFFIKPKQASLPKQQIKASPEKEEIRKILFEEKELRDLINLLKKSINLNDDIQSRALANKALKALQTKMQK